ncbi:hypothetical protein U1708_17740 [Sphingomonas sp. ZB1N12]|uniref:hypothetical protein n=1 Tax=Sphingomonas arabinosi TaxID=3096160 RepID=UPI002FCC9417
MADHIDTQRLIGDLAREGVVVSVDYAAGIARAIRRRTDDRRHSVTRQPRRFHVRLVLRLPKRQGVGILDLLEATDPIDEAVILQSREGTDYRFSRTP